MQNLRCECGVSIVQLSLRNILGYFSGQSTGNKDNISLWCSLVYIVSRQVLVRIRENYVGTSNGQYRNHVISNVLQGRGLLRIWVWVVKVGMCEHGYVIRILIDHFQCEMRCNT